MIKLKQYTVDVEGQKIGFWSNKPNSEKETYILLAPGAYSGDFFVNFESYFNDIHNFIAIDYPGRGQSEPQLDNTVEGVSATVLKFVKKLNISKFKLVGLSYGTQIALTLLKNEKLRIEEVILVAPGEYYLGYRRKLLLLLFSFIKLFPKLIPIVRNVIVGLGLMEYLPNKNNNFILEQWIGTLNFVFPDKLPDVMKVTVVNYEKDSCVNSTSLYKLRKLIPNFVQFNLKDSHPYTIKSFDSFFRDVWNVVYNK